MSERTENPSYYAIIPAEVRYDQRLSANEKLLYGELTALMSKEGYCWASNHYFATLYGVSVQSVSTWISHLAAAGHITVEVNRAAGNQRKVWATTTYSRKVEEGYSRKVEDPYSRKLEHITTRESTTSSNKIVAGGDGHKQLVDLYFELHKAKYGEKPIFGAAEGKLLQRLIKDQTVDDVARKLRLYYSTTFWFNKTSHDFRQFSAHFNEIVSGAKQPWHDVTNYNLDEEMAARNARAIQELGV